MDDHNVQDGIYSLHSLPDTLVSHTSLPVWGQPVVPNVPRSQIWHPETIQDIDTA